MEKEDLFLSVAEQRRLEMIESLSSLDNVYANQSGKVYDREKQAFVDYEGNIIRDHFGAPVGSLPKNSNSLREVPHQEHNQEYALKLVGEITCDAHAKICPIKNFHKIE